MEFPINISIGRFSISAHILFETLAFFIAYRYYLHLRSKTNDQISDEGRIWILIGAAAGAFLFSRLTGVMENPYAFISSPHKLLYFFSAKTIVGGLLGGLTGVELMKKIIGVKSSSGDLFTFPLLLGMIIGRIGCFTSGVGEDTYGIKTSLFSGMNLGDNILRHPVTLYEIVFLILLWIVLVHVKKKRILPEGWIFRYFMIGYLGFRFFLDFIKPTIPIILNLSFIQLMCVAGLIYYVRTIISLIFNPPQTRMHA
ncbi:prolipoprotein diacylglyceryl transferase [Pollutibacter soli]|uniref:prolipoprotein diacylglyceryl transferase n=1 Tax=Pollutibacter soli TaxID=3034157 RepID=UPI0030140658